MNFVGVSYIGKSQFIGSGWKCHTSWGQLLGSIFLFVFKSFRGRAVSMNLDLMGVPLWRLSLLLSLPICQFLSTFRVLVCNARGDRSGIQLRRLQASEYLDLISTMRKRNKANPCTPLITRFLQHNSETPSLPDSSILSFQISRR
jgi:hypothetical protein